MRVFLENHPVHAMTGGEHAHRLGAYCDAITGAGLRLQAVLGPWDSVINAYPLVRSPEELGNYPRIALRRRFGIAGALLSFVPGVRRLVAMRLRRPTPGRLYSFFATKLDIPARAVDNPARP